MKPLRLPRNDHRVTTDITELLHHRLSNFRDVARLLSAERRSLLLLQFCYPTEMLLFLFNELFLLLLMRNCSASVFGRKCSCQVSFDDIHQWTMQTCTLSPERRRRHKHKHIIRSIAIFLGRLYRLQLHIYLAKAYFSEVSVPNFLIELRDSFYALELKRNETKATSQWNSSSEKVQQSKPLRLWRIYHPQLYPGRMKVFIFSSSTFHLSIHLFIQIFSHCLFLLFVSIILWFAWNVTKRYRCHRKLDIYRMVHIFNRGISSFHAVLQQHAGQNSVGLSAKHFRCRSSQIENLWHFISMTHESEHVRCDKWYVFCINGNNLLPTHTVSTEECVFPEWGERHRLFAMFAITEITQNFIHQWSLELFYPCCDLNSD